MSVDTDTLTTRELKELVSILRVNIEATLEILSWDDKPSSDLIADVSENLRRLSETK